MVDWKAPKSLLSFSGHKPPKGSAVNGMLGIAIDTRNNYKSCHSCTIRKNGHSLIPHP
jgi:hypothetical protein